MRRFFARRPTPAMAVAFVALVAALSGTAIALPGRNTVDSGDIKNKQVKGKDLANNAVTGKKVKNGAVGSADVGNDSLTGDDINESTLGKVPSATNADSASSASTVSDNAITTAKFATLPAARVTDSDGQSIANSATTAVNLNAETFDTAALHDNVTNNTRLTAPVDGLYYITGSVRWENNVAGRRIAMINHSADGQIARDAVSPNNNSTFGPEQDVDTIYRMTAGQFVELHVFQDSPGALNVVSFGASSPVLAMTWIGP